MPDVDHTVLIAIEQDRPNALIVGGLYFKRGQNNKVCLTLMTIMFLGFIFKINILPFI